MYAIVDIETTGGSPVKEKITEIAIYIHDGQKITNEFVTLINPEKNIPYNIIALTGITNEMVASAPKFYEIARDIVELTKDRTIIAHNSTFDYSFIRNEFRSLGYNFQREQLCTVKLSRKLIPGLRSYSLGAICSELGIEITDRHRAAGDALATAKLFDILMDLNHTAGLDLDLYQGLSKKGLHPAINIDSLRNLPEETGLYYFYNEKDELIYVGKSKNIKSRIISHLNNNSSKKAIDMRQQIANISYELTGSELIALLKESDEIKINKPLYNRTQRRALYQYGLYHHKDEKGYMIFSIDKNNADTRIPLHSFSSKRESGNTLNKLIEQYRLCQKLCGLYESNGPCFQYEIMECNGACAGKEPPEEYNKRAIQLVRSFSCENTNMVILDTGRNFEEYSVIKIENGKYLGYGYIDRDIQITDHEMVNDYIDKFNDNREIQSIIRKYLDTKRVISVLRF